ncbi:Eco57I restriction-modification methylase domain-containing protein [Ruegeria atlantica]|uniref:site-specific DNA-methyltransferase (adenine-specific) n=1 Tax=Ruegeria atlantica TaxID=81569 RepID=A0A0P1EUZ7_9RHOB|nr:type IIL restriction-modification enzyme MmeI [Ruegeria atlantica]CUH46443.1 hypothetical protein RUA4292_00609 [Ruegeria atlantica]
MSIRFDWLNLIELSGPFLAEPVLNQAMPDGLDALERNVGPRLRSAYIEWRDAVDASDPLLDAIHSAWIDEVLTNGLDYDEQTLLRGEEGLIGPILKLSADKSSRLPDMVLVDPSKPTEPLLLIGVHEPDLDLDVTQKKDGNIATPKEAMVNALRKSGCPLGLVTNGEAWTLVHAPEGEIASFATWYARMFGLERDTLRAFVSLLELSRFTGPASESLPELFNTSKAHQGDVTEALGDQVADAIEVLMRALDRADQDRNRDLLADVEPTTLYEAGLTLMMRLVVILSAEERDLLLLGDPIYDANYAISSLRAQLSATDPEILERRNSAWSRLLATFRLVHAGVDHPDLRLPALGGSLFHPDRFPFLEGRKRGSTWQSEAAEPLPIDDRTVLLLLEAIQRFRGRTLSYRALDVEQIGHVYEGLLDQTADRVTGLTLQLKGASKAKTPLVKLEKLERLNGSERIKHLVEVTERSEGAIKSDLEKSPDASDQARLLTSCRADADLRDRILPYVHLIDVDPWGMPIVHHDGAIVIVRGTDRRESGSHYTPKSLTEKIVEETLTPVVYRGPAEGVDEADWELKSPAEILDLKICDPAMGSGAFLVQVCRWLSVKLVEAWGNAEERGGFVDAEGAVHESQDTVKDPLPLDIEERTIEARRLIAEKCLYGVDMNPMAVELAKLSLWLTTVAKGRPFGFLDHNLRSGDSLLGIDDINQVIELNMKPKRGDQLNLFGRSIRSAVDQAIELRKQLRATPIRDVEDVKAMERLDQESRRLLDLPLLISDAFVGCILAKKKGSALSEELGEIGAHADEAVGANPEAVDLLSLSSRRDLSVDASNRKPRMPFHWPLEFPEVFEREDGGFDAFIGNPPFLGGQRITGIMGTVYRDWLVAFIAEGRRGSADLVSYFFLRVAALLRDEGSFGLLAVNTISEGDTREVGLDAILGQGFTIYAAYPNEKWPGSAAVVTSRVHARKGDWNANAILLGKETPYISAQLSDDTNWTPVPLKSNQSLAFQGCCTRSTGFIIPEDLAREMLSSDPKNCDVVFPYLNGRDLNSDPFQKATRWAINFWDWSEERASKYEVPFSYVAENAKPDRFRKKANGQFACAEPLRREWWLYEGKRSGLFHAIGRGHHFEKHPEGWVPTSNKLDRVLALTRVSKTLAFCLVDARSVYSDQTIIFATDDHATLSLLQSSIHSVYAWQHSSKLKNDLRYSRSDVLETFPFPRHVVANDMRDLGAALEKERNSIMVSQEIGLTKLYNSMHSQDKNSVRLQDMRDLHASIDQAVLASYDWSDIELEHDFHAVPYLPESDRIRFTISEGARREILRRLAELNRERYQEEVEQGLHGEAKEKKKSSPKRSKAVATPAEPTLPLDAPEPSAKKSPPKRDAILSFLKNRPGRHGKANIFQSVRMTSSEWKEAIDELVSEGLVSQQGTAPNFSYSISEAQKND